MANRTQLSKFLALVLRHQADAYNLTLDDNGFVDVQLVWDIIEREFGDSFTYDDLLMVVEGDSRGKKRYELADDKIRAMFGHSAVREITYPIVTPPQNLYHGTIQDAIKSIKQHGLQAQSRQYVHLTTNLNNARQVANRHSKNIIILRVQALEAHNQGIIFHQPEVEHFLCKSIPPEYIDFDSDH